MADDNFLAPEMDMRLNLLTQQVERFQKRYGYALRVKDFSGLMRAHPLLSEFIARNMVHDNSFCLYMKNRQDVFDQCVFRSNELLMRKLMRIFKGDDHSPADFSSSGMERGFYGVCWGGIQEYVFPVCHSGIVIGAMLVGPFRADPKQSERAFRRMNIRYGISEDILRENYNAVTLPCPAGDRDFEEDVALLANYLSMLVEYYIEHSLAASFARARSENSKQNQLVSRAIEYINDHYTERITVSNIARACYCSQSSLNHLFPAVVKRTIPEFVAIQRVNHAKHLLVNTSLSIEQIGTACGFASAAYFSTVFKRITRISPNQYRKYVMKKKFENFGVKKRY